MSVALKAVASHDSRLLLPGCNIHAVYMSGAAALMNSSAACSFENHRYQSQKSEIEPWLATPTAHSACWCFGNGEIVERKK
jgi:hypothetical protein